MMNKLRVGFTVTEQDIDKGCFHCIQRNARCHKPNDFFRLSCWECILDGQSSQCSFTSPIDPKKYILESPPGNKFPQTFQTFQPSNTFQTKEASSFGQSNFNMPYQHQYIPPSNVQSSFQTKETGYFGQSPYQQHRTDNVAIQYIQSSDAAKLSEPIISAPKLYAPRVDKPCDSSIGMINHDGISPTLTPRIFAGKSYKENPNNGRYLDELKKNNGDIETEIDYERSERCVRSPQSDLITDLTSYEELRKLAESLGIRTFFIENCIKEKQIETDTSLLAFDASEGLLLDDGKEIAVKFMQQRQFVKGTVEKINQTKLENDLTLLAQLASSRNIVRLLGLTFDDFHPIFILERTEMTLEKYLKNHSSGLSAVSWYTKLHLCIHICYGVQDIHRSRIIHGDLSGSNILIFQSKTCNEPCAKLSSVAFRSTLKNKKNTITPFTAPECTRFGVSKYPEFREWCEWEVQDVYSIGLLLWQMAMNGKVPYENMDPSSIEIAKANDPDLNNLMDQLPISTPKDVRLCIQMATKYMPSHRATLSKLLTLLCNALASTQIQNDIIPKAAMILDKAQHEKNDVIIPKNDNIPKTYTMQDNTPNELILPRNDATPRATIVEKSPISGPTIPIQHRKFGRGSLRRVPIACDNCRYHKRKCSSGLLPCTRCNKKGIKCEKNSKFSK